MLKRARGESGGLYLGRATAAARWQPAGRSGAAWQSDGSTARGVEERRDLWRDAWEGHVKLEVVGLTLSGGGTEQRRREAEEQAGGRRRGLLCNFRKFQEPSCKSKITFNLQL